MKMKENIKIDINGRGLEDSERLTPAVAAKNAAYLPNDETGRRNCTEYNDRAAERDHRIYGC